MGYKTNIGKTGYQLTEIECCYTRKKELIKYDPAVFSVNRFLDKK